METSDPSFIVPPGSRPARGVDSTVVRPARHPELSPTLKGSPGTGPGYSLVGHTHPLQPSSATALGARGAAVKTSSASTLTSGMTLTTDIVDYGPTDYWSGGYFDPQVEGDYLMTAVLGISFDPGAGLPLTKFTLSFQGPGDVPLTSLIIPDGYNLSEGDSFGAVYMHLTAICFEVTSTCDARISYVSAAPFSYSVYHFVQYFQYLGPVAS